MMNAFLMVTNHNESAMLQFAEELRERQMSPNTGKLLVCAGYFIDDAVLEVIGDRLARSFEVVELAKAHTSLQQANDKQLATMMASFIMTKYTTVPGPWLVVDERYEITQNDPLTLLQYVHNAGAQDNSGRATTEGGGRVPVGPVVLGAPYSAIKILRSATEQSWRQRGRWAFNMAGWNQIESGEYPFRIPSLSDPATTASSTIAPRPSAKPAASTPQARHTLPVAGPYVPPDPNRPKASSGMIAVTQQSENAAHKAETLAPEMPKAPTVAEVAAMAAKVQLQDENEPIDDRFSPENYKPRGMPFIPLDPSQYEKANNDVLIAQLAHRLGKKPHPKTGRDKLISKLRDLDAQTTNS